LGPKWKKVEQAVGVSLLPTAEDQEKEIRDKNLQDFTPSILIGKGHWELKIFSNLYTQTQVFSSEGKLDLNGRQSFFTVLNQFLFGLGRKVNIGADLWLKTSREDTSSSASAIGVFKFDGAPVQSYGVPVFGPKIKWAPFNKIQRLSVQTGVFFPLRKDLENRDSDEPFLALDRRLLWLSSIFFDQPLGPKFQVFTRVSFWYYSSRDSFRKNSYLETPISVFLSYFPTHRITLYIQGEYWPTHYDDINQKGESFSQYFAQAGIGGKYQIIPGLLEGELLYTKFLAGSFGKGAGQTFNLGIRIIH
jgi:hypothetical protein